MTNSRNLTIPEMAEFLKAPKVADFHAPDQKEAYDWICCLLVNQLYWRLMRHQKGIIRQYIRRMTGYSRAQTNRLISRWKKTGRIERIKNERSEFPTIYQRKDIALLADADKALLFPSGPALARNLRREFEIHHHNEYETISQISPSHIYNLRKTFTYRDLVGNFEHTHATVSIIGVRAKPAPGGAPGYIRVDTVHQGDFQGEKGVYHINLVDEVTQWEIVISVSQITERFLLPILEKVLFWFPFVIHEFHADNGSEYINHQVAKMLNKLNIKLSKSRPRQTGDNALAESKNASVIRHHMGYAYIPRSAASTINVWYEDYFNPYLNFHRPCAFCTTITDSKGKEKKVYKPKDYQTPYEKLMSLPDAEKYLREGITFEMLGKIANTKSDIEFAKLMAKSKTKLFETITKIHKNDILQMEINSFTIKTN